MFSVNLTLYKILLKDLPKGANYLKFNQNQWQKNTTNTASARQYMLKDIVRNILPGRNRSEIENILGVPDRSYYNRIDYITGQERGYISIDMEILQI